jgi:hypothetical protein
MHRLRLPILLALAAAAGPAAAAPPAPPTAAAPAPAAPPSHGARGWQGIEPGRSHTVDVTARFGVPTTQGKIGGRTAIVYRGDQAIGGTRQAQFFAADDGVVSEVVVFPASQLDRETVEGTYGHPARKTFTRDDFRPVWMYDAAGVTVFFTREGMVDAISFKAPPPRELPRPVASDGAAPPPAPAPPPEAR